MPGTLENLDRGLFLFCNRTLAHPLLDRFFTVITEPVFWLIPLIPVLIWYTVRYKKKVIWPLVLAVITIAFTDPVCYRILKPLFGRLRPCHPDALVEGGRFLLGYKKSFSFPSNHAMNIFAQSWLWSHLYPRGRTIFWTLAGLVAYSRVYCGVHYPADVATGAVFGILSAMMMFTVANRVRGLYFKKHGENGE